MAPKPGTEELLGVADVEEVDDTDEEEEYLDVVEDVSFVNCRATRGPADAKAVRQVREVMAKRIFELSTAVCVE